MTITREQFIARLEEVGFKGSAGFYRCNLGNLLLLSNPAQIAELEIYILDNMNIFIWNGSGYLFDELEQFLIDKGILGKPFDAHAYLIECGFTFDDEYKEYRKSKSSNIYIEAWQTIKELKGLKVIHTKKIEGNDKQSCDLAIKLVNFLEKLESEND